MAKYQVTCPGCGESYTTVLFGKSRDREWKLEHWDWTCDDCRRAAREQENKEQAEANRAEGLPPLTGSEKQVLWAESIRADRLNEISEFAKALVERTRAGIEAHGREKADQAARREGFSSVEQLLEAVAPAEQRLVERTRASWWIDNRSTHGRELLVAELKTAPATAVETAPAADEAKAAATVRPPEAVSETVAEIRLVGERTLDVSFPERLETFRSTIKAAGFRWDGDRWRRSLHKITDGNPADRLAEIGNLLLSVGFVVRIHDDEARRRAVDGSFEPARRRWVMVRTAGDFAGWFCIVWPREDDFYAVARQLAGSRYSKPDVVVPAEQFEEVLDFAEVHGFCLSPGALALADKARAERDAALVAEPTRARKVSGRKAAAKPAPLPVPEQVEIDGELLDEEVAP